MLNYLSTLYTRITVWIILNPRTFYLIVSIFIICCFQFANDFSADCSYFDAETKRQVARKVLNHEPLTRKEYGVYLEILDDLEQKKIKDQLRAEQVAREEPYVFWLFVISMTWITLLAITGQLGKK